MTWTCPNCNRDYPDSSLGVPGAEQADRKDGCKVCAVNPEGMNKWVVE